MKKYTPLLILYSFISSCAIKHNYECTSTTWGNGGFMGTIEKRCTEKEIEKYIEEHTIDLDGNDQVLSNGEMTTTCIKK